MLLRRTVDYDFRRMLRRSSAPPVFRIVGEALVLTAEVSQLAVEKGWISTPDLASPAILRYEDSALGSTRVI